jgi:hypothetical protein
MEAERRRLSYAMWFVAAFIVVLVGIGVRNFLALQRLQDRLDTFVVNYSAEVMNQRAERLKQLAAITARINELERHVFVDMDASITAAAQPSAVRIRREADIRRRLTALEQWRASLKE